MASRPCSGEWEWKAQSHHSRWLTSRRVPWISTYHTWRKSFVQLTECVPQVAYDSIHWPNDTGDLAVVLPRLRLKDVNPNDLAVELRQKVGWHCPDFSCGPSSLSV